MRRFSPVVPLKLGELLPDVEDDGLRRVDMAEDFLIRLGFGGDRPRNGHRDCERDGQGDPYSTLGHGNPFGDRDKGHIIFPAFGIPCSLAQQQHGHVPGTSAVDSDS